MPPLQAPLTITTLAVAPFSGSRSAGVTVSPWPHSGAPAGPEWPTCTSNVRARSARKTPVSTLFNPAASAA